MGIVTRVVLRLWKGSSQAGFEPLREEHLKQSTAWTSGRLQTLLANSRAASVAMSCPPPLLLSLLLSLDLRLEFSSGNLILLGCSVASSSLLSSGAGGGRRLVLVLTVTVVLIVVFILSGEQLRAFCSHKHREE